MQSIEKLQGGLLKRSITKKSIARWKRSLFSRISPGNISVRPILPDFMGRFPLPDGVSMIDIVASRTVYFSQTAGGSIEKSINNRDYWPGWFLSGRNAARKGL
jgi:hypothetical protein